MCLTRDFLGVRGAATTLAPVFESGGTPIVIHGTATNFVGVPCLGGDVEVDDGGGARWDKFLSRILSGAFARGVRDMCAVVQVTHPLLGVMRQGSTVLHFCVGKWMIPKTKMVVAQRH